MADIITSRYAVLSIDDDDDDNKEGVDVSKNKKIENDDGEATGSLKCNEEAASGTFEKYKEERGVKKKNRVSF